jgi:CheY-like chemotaxis protein
MVAEGYDVLTAANGREALDLLSGSAERPRVIVLDLMMPVMNGWVFLEHFREEEAYRGINVVICSAAKDEAPKGVPLLKKPIDLDDLTYTVARLCDA